MNCPHCNVPIDSDDVFCGECGRDTRSSAPAVSAPPPQAPAANVPQPIPVPPPAANAAQFVPPLPAPAVPKKKRWRIILIVMGLLIACNILVRIGEAMYWEFF